MIPAERRRLTGRQVLLWLLLFFGIVALVNGAMVWLALETTEVMPRPISARTPNHPSPDSAMRDIGGERPPWLT